MKIASQIKCANCKKPMTVETMQMANGKMMCADCAKQENKMKK